MTAAWATTGIFAIVERRETSGCVVFMRRLICFLLYLGMILFGLAALGLFLIGGGRGIVSVAGGFLAGLGAHLMWIDFLSPNTRHL
jgi:hypothetical protein